MRYSFLIVFIAALLAGCKQEEKKKRIYTPDPAIDALAANDIKLGEPSPGDWLDVHVETGQSFDRYIKSNPVTPSETRNKIYLQPLGRFSVDESNLVKATADYLQLFFNLETRVLPVLSDSIVPPSARRINGQEQLKTGFIMDYLQQHIPDDGIVIMAITPLDLYPSSDFNFVFGQARTKNRVGVSSFNRFISGPLESPYYELCLSRLIKTSSHEIGHMFTCMHCIHAACLMNGTNSLSETDSRPSRLCSECLRKLHWNLHFNIEGRLKSMQAYFTTHNLFSELAMVNQDLAILQKTQ